MTGTPAGDTFKNASDLFQQTMNTFADMVEQSTTLSLDLLNSFTRNLSNVDLSSIKMPAMPAMPKLDLSSMKMPTLASCGCKIPPPCWMPQSAGDLVSHVCPGTPAVLRIRVTNCGPVDRTIQFDDAGKKAVTFQPGTLTLGPMESGDVTATLASASSSGEGDERDALVWIRGCKDHYIRWTVKTAKRGAACCHEISVEDCPDFIHHWYDHFYCARPCPSRRRNA